MIGCGGFLLFLTAQFWLLPMIDNFAERPHCYSVFGIQLVNYFWYLVFVGLPLSIFIPAMLLIPSGVKGWKQGQFPPIGTKVFRRTRIKVGVQGKLFSAFQMLPAILVLALSVWGYFQASALSPIDLSQFDLSLCEK
ncbi:hypothetical protein [Grimontia sp. SpTr1]|uniref:hypothetical protein n=1 Tax=Grimontia sp. SpTr1 TaxID=2995319 RepID=UPI00248B0625|nr:hypothetical protein [Grimontia sp. SpTr1]